MQQRGFQLNLSSPEARERASAAFTTMGITQFIAAILIGMQADRIRADLRISGDDDGPDSPRQSRKSGPVPVSCIDAVGKLLEANKDDVPKLAEIILDLGFPSRIGMEQVEEIILRHEAWFMEAEAHGLTEEDAEWMTELSVRFFDGFRFGVAAAAEVDAGGDLSWFGNIHQ